MRIDRENWAQKGIATRNINTLLDCNKSCYNCNIVCHTLNRWVVIPLISFLDEGIAVMTSPPFACFPMVTNDQRDNRKVP